MRDRQHALYAISVAAELSGTGVQNLRVYERRGLVDPERTAGVTRRYSEEDVERLVRLAGYPAALAADVEAISGKPPAMVERERVSAPTVSLIDQWAAIADGPATHPGPAPLTPAS